MIGKSPMYILTCFDIVVIDIVHPLSLGRDYKDSANLTLYELANSNLTFKMKVRDIDDVNKNWQVPCRHACVNIGASRSIRLFIVYNRKFREGCTN